MGRISYKLHELGFSGSTPMKFFKTITPNIIKQSVATGRRHFRQSTGALRLLPDFIIIGGQRCGTTTLYNYLIRHPHVISTSLKEIHYFDLNYTRGTIWYRTHFPLTLEKRYHSKRKNSPILTGESTPYYLFHPHVPQRVAALLPQVKLIVLLRNPIDRAYSHYHHAVRWQLETAPTFEAAIDQEAGRLATEWERLAADEHYYSYNHHHHAYLTRGIYAGQLQNWFDYFPRKQFFITSSEHFYRETATVFQTLLDFLDLPTWQPDVYTNYNQAQNAPLSAALRTRLETYFAPHNQRLYELLGCDFEW